MTENDITDRQSSITAFSYWNLFRKWKVVVTYCTKSSRQICGHYGESNHIPVHQHHTSKKHTMSEKIIAYVLNPSPWRTIQVHSVTGWASAEESSVPIPYVFRWSAGPTEGSRCCVEEQSCAYRNQIPYCRGVKQSIVIYWSIVADFWSLWTFIGLLRTINSSSIESIFY